MCFLSAMIQAKSVGDNEFHLVYNGDGPPNGYLYITSTREGQEVTVSVSNYDLKKVVSLEATTIRKSLVVLLLNQGTVIWLAPCISSPSVIKLEASELPRFFLVKLEPITLLLCTLTELENVYKNLL